MVEMARMGMRSVEAEGEGVRKIKLEIKVEIKVEIKIVIKIVIKIKRSQDNCCEYQSLDVLWSAVN